jgi:hypothetical protein
MRASELDIGGQPPTGTGVEYDRAIDISAKIRKYEPLNSASAERDSPLAPVKMPRASSEVSFAGLHIGPPYYGRRLDGSVGSIPWFRWASRELVSRSVSLEVLPSNMEDSSD